MENYSERNYHGPTVKLNENMSLQGFLRHSTIHYWLMEKSIFLSNLQIKKKKQQISVRTGLECKVIVKLKKLSKIAYDSAKRSTEVYT